MNIMGSEKLNRFEFWEKLFPEIKDVDELKSFLKKNFNEDAHKLEEKFYILDNDEQLAKEIEEVDLKQNFIEQLERNLDYIKNTYIWVYAYKPILLKNTSKLYKSLDNVKYIADKNKFFTEIILGVIKKLHSISYRTMIFEIKRLKGECRLKGYTPEERGSYFANVCLKDDEYISELYSYYPEMKRVMDNVVINQANYVEEIINNTSKEYCNLCEKFNVDVLETIEISAGDTHNKGKAVSIMKFRNGRRLIYKPRSSGIDVAFNEFIEWINENKSNNILDLKTVNVYSNKSDSKCFWVEFIEHDECKDEDMVKNFYYRIGQVSAILNIFNSKDFHHENIIACGEYPILIDLETLFFPDFDKSSLKEKSAIEVANKYINNSLKASGLLPLNIINLKNSKVVDLSGVSCTETQESHIRSAHIENYGTDEVSIKREFSKINPQNNNPVLNGERVDSQKYVNEIKTGFINMYMYFMNNKATIKKVISRCFDDKKCRVVFRATATYAQVLYASYNPALYRNPIDRQVYLYRIGLTKEKLRKEVIISEYNQLMNSDIPFFEAKTNSTEIICGDGLVIPSYYDKTILDSVGEKIDSLSRKDLEKQVAIINMSFLNKVERQVKVKENPELKEKYSSEINIKDKGINLAKKIAYHVLDKSISGKSLRDREEITWIGSIEIIRGVKDVFPVEFDLYLGNGGIALYLTYLSKLTQDESLKEAIEKTIEPIICKLDNMKLSTKDDMPVYMGGYNGIYGQILALFVIANELNDSELLEFVYSKIDFVKDMEIRDKDSDIISGGAGIILALMYMYEKTKELSFKEKLLKLANNISERVMENAEEEGDTVKWGKEGYSGFSHGNAGIITSLYKLYSINKDIRILNIIKKALKFERSLFNKELGNWKKSEVEDEYSIGWCHGAPGILLSRLILKKHGYVDEFIDDEINICINFIKEKGLGNDYCLCHGDFGNLIILQEAALYLEDEYLQECVISTLQDYIDTIINDNWIEKNFKFNECNGLMTGITGIGYAILKLIFPHKLINILSLT